MAPCIDIHCHILPGVDDGSPDTDTSLQMLRIAQSEGTVAVILTPHHKPMHHNVSPGHMLKYRDGLKEEAQKAGINVKLFTGNELYYCAETIDELLNGRAVTLSDSGYVLVEFHPTDLYRTVRQAAYDLQAAGYMPVIAHIERYQDIVGHPGYVSELIDMGCTIQVNASSVMGKYGGGIKRFTRGLLERREVHFVATDAHDSRNRSPKIAECRAFVESRYGVPYANDIFYNNPLRILKHEVISG